MVSSATIKDLPLEMIREIFKHLRPNDLVACARVNKRWNSVYSGFRVRRLVAIQNYWYFPSKLYNSNQPIRKELCHLNWFFRLKDKPLFSNLTHLAFCGFDSDLAKLDLNVLNKFSQLIHLEIIVGVLVVKEVNLNLPKLRTLALHGCNNSRFLVDCPELSVLLHRDEAPNETLLVIKYPETIKRIETDLPVSKLTLYKNVECLITGELKAIHKDTLLSLPKLNELRYNKEIRFWINSIGRPFCPNETFKRFLNNFLDDFKMLRGPEFMFIFAGLQLNKANLSEIDLCLEESKDRSWYASSPHVYLENYELIVPGTVDFIKDLNYNFLMENVPEDIPKCFSKFTGVLSVWIGERVKDENHLLTFLKSLISLRELFLTKSQLSQKFYDSLPTSVHFLVKLTLIEEKVLNFEFIGKLLNLKNLCIPVDDLSLASLTSLAKGLKNLRCLEECRFCFCVKEVWFHIEKFEGSNVWKVTENESDKTVFVTKDPFKIGIFFKRFRVSQLRPVWKL